MTQNDQAAMNEQLTELRLNGLSIDGDNRYKQDLIDAVIGAMMFGAQGANPPPAGHWLEQFYVIAREEREALARVEAERDAARSRQEHTQSTLRTVLAELQSSQAQLAEMRRIVAGFLFNYDDGVGKPWERRLLNYARKLVDAKEFNAQAEQQEAQSPMAKMAEGLRQKAADEWANHPSNPANEGAQDSQAGEFQREDRYIVIKRKDLEAVVTDREWFKNALSLLELYLPKREYLVIESDWPEYEPTWAAIQARVEGRAALATQPAVPVVEHPVVKALLEVAAAAHQALEGTDSGFTESTWGKGDFERLDDAMDALDELPDDQSGYVMEPAAKAAWALRNLNAVRGAEHE